jgi:tryptophanase
MATNYRSYTLRPPSHNALVVRTVPEVTPEDREKILEDVGYNIFAYPAGLVTCDFLSDSGTSAMMDVQWAACKCDQTQHQLPPICSKFPRSIFVETPSDVRLLMRKLAVMRGNESYGRDWGYYCLLDAFRDIFERGKNHQRIFDKIVAGPLDADYYRSTVLVPHQGGLVNGGRHQLERPNFFIAPKGRCAKNFLFSAMSGVIAQGTSKTSYAIISNGFLDTTGAHAEKAGFKLQTLIQPGLNEPFPGHLIGKRNPFKGNLDVTAAEAYIKSNPDKVAMVLTTITNNWAAGQPVSMENIRSTAAVAKRHGIPFFFDACRFAENAFFIHEYEHGYADKSIPEIVQEMFSYVDGFTISLKKNGLANMGGVLCFRDQGAFAKKYPFAGEQIKERQILTYGNDSCGASE